MPYKSILKSADWQDLTPLPSPEDGEVLVSIAYSAEFRHAFELFRAVLKKGEKSKRVLDLTLELININSANYTVWYYRRLCLLELKSDLYKELELTEQLTEVNVKNYQVWFHRRWLVEKLDDHGTVADELHTCAQLLESDNKNYNAWSHRIWINDHFSMWEDELKFANEMIETDVHNNSAWNHRMLVLHKQGTWTFNEKTQETKRGEEIEFVLSSLRAYPGNEAAWNYLSAYFCNEADAVVPPEHETSDPHKATKRPLLPPAVGCPKWRWRTARNSELETFCKGFDPEKDLRNGLRFATQVLAWICADSGETSKAIEHYEKLSTIDAIRRRYWAYQIQLLDA